MNEADFDDWSEYHRSLFAMRATEDVALVRAWWPSLCSFPSADCMQASRDMAERNPPAFRDKHLARLLELLGGIAMRRRQSEYEESVSEAPDCPDCLGTGLVVVPHIRFIDDGAWVRCGKSYMTMGVACSCVRGARIEEAQKRYGDERAQRLHKTATAYGYTLRSYALRVPHWRQLLTERAVADKQEREAEAQAAHLDRKLGRLDVSGIKARVAVAMKVPR